MAVFFLVVGLEIKRELLFGELASWRQAALPVIAALGGMVVPGLLFALVNAGTPTMRGWAIPTATDIAFAFAIGILSLLGSRVPLGLKVFLTALAIANDLGAVVVIAVFYAGTIDLAWLAAAAAMTLVAWAAGRAGLRHPLAWAGMGILLWICVHESGVHATIAGVALAAVVPAGSATIRRQIDAHRQAPDQPGPPAETVPETRQLDPQCRLRLLRHLCSHPVVRLVIARRSHLVVAGRGQSIRRHRLHHVAVRQRIGLRRSAGGGRPG